jgi:hypothetical protein
VAPHLTTNKTGKTGTWFEYFVGRSPRSDLIFGDGDVETRVHCTSTASRDLNRVQNKEYEYTACLKREAPDS